MRLHEWLIGRAATLRLDAGKAGATLRRGTRLDRDERRRPERARALPDREERTGHLGMGESECGGRARLRHLPRLPSSYLYRRSLRSVKVRGGTEWGRYCKLRWA